MNLILKWSWLLLHQVALPRSGNPLKCSVSQGATDIQWNVVAIEDKISITGFIYLLTIFLIATSTRN